MVFFEFKDDCVVVVLTHNFRLTEVVRIVLINNYDIINRYFNDLHDILFEVRIEMELHVNTLKRVNHALIWLSDHYFLGLLYAHFDRRHYFCIIVVFYLS